jgi:CRP/FNR family transcriptional regulator, nitrogen oxide reductase regulator
MSALSTNLYQHGEPFWSRNNGAVLPSLVHRNHGDKHDGTVGQRPALFSGVQPADYSRIVAAARVREFARGEMLFIEGDSVQQVLLLTSGFAKINKLGLSGTEVILRFSAPGDVLGAMGLFSTGRHCTTAQSFRMCRALVWEPPAFRALAEQFPVLHQNMARIVGGELLELEERFREVATERVAPRVARQLVRLLDKIGRRVEDGVEISLSREELAQMTGTTLFTVSRLLSVWEERGMVKPRREGVTVCNIPALNAISE